MDDLIDWINHQIESRGWNYADIARRGGISRATISTVLSGQSRPGIHFCQAVARAFQVRPEVVFRLAGILPALPPAAQGEEELIALFRALSDRDQAVVLVQLRALAGRSPFRAGDRSPLDSALESQILAELRKLDPESRQEAAELAQAGALRIRFVAED